MKEQNENRLIYIIVSLLGAGILFPWNAWITASDYFDEEYPDYYPLFTFPVIYNVFSIPILYFLARIRATTRLNYGFHIIVWYVIGFVCLASIPLLGTTEDSWSAETRFALTSFGVFLTGIGTSMLYGTLFAFFAPMDALFTQALMNGMGVAGVIVGTLRVITKASTDDLKLSTAIYFSLSAAVMLSCVIGFTMVVKTETVRKQTSYTKHQGNGNENGNDIVVDHGKLKKNDLTTPLMIEEVLNQQPLLSSHSSSSSSSSSSSASSVIINNNEKKSYHTISSEDEENNSDASGKKKKKNDDEIYSKVFKEIKFAGGMIFFDFFVTLSIFPGLITKIESTEDVGSWFIVILISIFQVGDAIGRALPGYPSVGPVFQLEKIWIPITLRIIFYPAFLIIYYITISDYVTYLVMLIFAVSNGFLGSSIMMLAPAKMQTLDEKEICGTSMTLFLQGGVIAGSTFAWIFTAFM